MPKILLFLVVGLVAGIQANMCATDYYFNSAATTTIGDSSYTCATIESVWISVRGPAASDAVACDATFSSSPTLFKSIAWLVALDCCRL
eukprot:scaffold49332_cov63-Phaeocystis_antarctica.AAC.1